MKIEPNYMGQCGFLWFYGVVESRLDPNKNGRLKVRIFGSHTDSKILIPTCELFWCEIHKQITTTATNGLGISPNGPVEGEHVYGFFRDSESKQDPVILGVLGGIPQDAPNTQLGFYDPGPPFHQISSAPRKIRSRYYPNDGTGAQLINETVASLYPRTNHPWGCIVGESDTNRLARAEKIQDTIIGVRQRQRDVHVPIAFAHTQPTRKWNEPKSSYNAQYPYNHVTETESGHIFEFDDTPGAERIHLYHRSGTFVEIQGGTDGDFVMKVVGKKSEIVMEQSRTHFQNTMSVTVDGECNIYCRSNANLQVDGDLNVHVGGDLNEKVQGNYNIDVKGNYTLKTKGNISESALGSVSIASAGTITQSAGSKFSLTSGTLLAGDAPQIHWNSGLSSTVTPQNASIPDFPAPLNQWVESINETDADPLLEEKPDNQPVTTNQKDC